MTIYIKKVKGQLYFIIQYYTILLALTIWVGEFTLLLTEPVSQWVFSPADELMDQDNLLLC